MNLFNVEYEENVTRSTCNYSMLLLISIKCIVGTEDVVFVGR